MSERPFENSREFAQSQDSQDPLAGFRERFHFPKSNGKECLYFVGNSLGLQPKRAQAYVAEAMEDWAQMGAEAHLHARHAWFPYHEFVTEPMARVVGAKPNEVVVMNTLSVNLHLMLVSFYRPQAKRFKILIEENAFPSDRYAAASQARWHGFDPNDAILEMKARPGEFSLRPEDILQTIDEAGESIALVLLGNVNYLSGQAFDVPAITRAAHAKGCRVGFDLAHGAGNLRLKLHEWGPDFAVWCSYKYLNAGPGGLGGVFVHERHLNDRSLARFEGWWGHNKQTRFQMGPTFDPIGTAETWQLSNPPILPLACLRASLEVFDEATVERIRTKGDRLTSYLEFLIEGLPGKPLRILTPKMRGSQLSARSVKDPKVLREQLLAAGVWCDFRAPDILRFSPVALYTRFEDVYRLAQVLEEHAK